MFLNGFSTSTETPARASMTLNSAGILAVPPDEARRMLAERPAEVAITDVGLADEQIPPYVVDIPEIASIDHNSDLILHGAFFGVGYNF